MLRSRARCGVGVLWAGLRPVGRRPRDAGRRFGVQARVGKEWRHAASGNACELNRFLFLISNLTESIEEYMTADLIWQPVYQCGRKVFRARALRSLSHRQSC